MFDFECCLILTNTMVPVLSAWGISNTISESPSWPIMLTYTWLPRKLALLEFSWIPVRPTTLITGWRLGEFYKGNVPLKHLSTNRCIILCSLLSLAFWFISLRTCLVYSKALSFVVFDEAKKVDSQQITRCHEVEHFYCLSTSNKWDVHKSFHRSKEILPFTKEELAKMAVVPYTDKSVKVIVGKLPGSLLIQFYVSFSLSSKWI